MMQWKRLIQIFCLVAYMVAFAHTVVPHEYHVHESVATCTHECEHGHHHHHLPHHSCDQLSSVYDFSDSQDSVQLPLYELVISLTHAVLMPVKEVSETVISGEMDDAPPPLPAHGSVTGFRAPPRA